MNHFLYQLRRVRLRDLRQVWKLPLALLCVPFYRLKHKDLWIICEDRNEARDNGFWFYRHVKATHPEQECVYAISSQSPDFNKIASLGEWVEFGSLRHWILYFASSKKVSSQKAGNPNAAIFYALEVYGLLKDKRIFLQHGITINNGRWLYYDVTRFHRFICGALPEYEYIMSRFGYPKQNVAYTGFCRFDGLHENIRSRERLILIMPTWREWIADEDSRLLEYEGTTDIAKTNYFISWADFINDERLSAIARDYGCKIVFFPHRNMQKYMNYFPESDEHVEVADATRYGVQELMKKASMMVTDYSSVFMDMLYMKKPVVFYQFDYEKFRKGQYGEGCFDYQNNPFAKSFDNKEAVFREVEYLAETDFLVSEEYLEAHDKCFRIYDNNNCERVYEVVRDA